MSNATPEIERLSMLIQALANVQLMASDIIIFGYDNRDEPQGETAREALERKVGILGACICNMFRARDISAEAVEQGHQLGHNAIDGTLPYEKVKS